MLVLAVQLGGSRGIFADPDPLPDPPALERYLLESPWPVVVGLVVVGLLVLTGLRSAGRGRLGLALGGAALAAAGGVWLLARLVVTEREALAGQTEALIRAAVAADAAAAGAALRDDVSLTLLGRQSSRRKEYLVDLVRQDVVGRYNAKDSRVRWVTAALDGPGAARTQAKVNVRSSLTEGDLATTWLLEWRKDGQGTWRVWSIEAQQIGLLPRGSLGDI